MKQKTPTLRPPSKLRLALALLYAPWTWGVFVPILAATTVFWGLVAVGICKLSKRVAFHCGTIWAFFLCLTNFTWVSVKGRNNVDKKQSYVIMCNHQSQFDILSFYGFWGYQFRWIMKKELRDVPCLGWACEEIGHVFIDRSNKEKAIASLNAARPLLEGGISVLIFPEGSRSRDGRMRQFKKGGFMMALQMGLPILPVSISGSGRVLPGKSVLLLPGKVTITIHDPIEVKEYGMERRDDLMRDVRRAIGQGLSEWERADA